jgi:hypothetical protein
MATKPIRTSTMFRAVDSLSIVMAMTGEKFNRLPWIVKACPSRPNPNNRNAKTY